MSLAPCESFTGCHYACGLRHHMSFWCDTVRDERIWISIRTTKIINPINIMTELFLPNPDSGFFGTIAHWLGMGFIFSFVLGLPLVAMWSLLLFFPAVFMMIIFD